MEREILNKLRAAQSMQIPLKFLENGENVLSKIAEDVARNLSLSEISQKYPSIYWNDLLGIYNNYRAELQISKQETFNQINEWLEMIEQDPIVDLAELDLLTRGFLEQYQKDFLSDSQKLEKIQELQEQLNAEQPLPVTNFEITQTQLSAEFLWRGQIPTREDSYPLFDQSEVSERSPYLHWQTGLSQSPNIYKIYQGLKAEPIDLSAIRVATSSKNETATFLFTTQNHQAEYNVEKNLLKVSLPDVQAQEKVVSGVKELFGVELINVVENEISGTGYIFGVEIDPLLLAHFVLNYELFSTFFFTRDTLSNIQTAKKTTKIYYRTGGLEQSGERAVAVSFQQLYARGDESFLLNNGETFAATTNTPYLRVQVKAAKNVEQVQEILEISSRLLGVYNSEKTELEQIYQEYIPNFTDLEMVSKTTGVNRDSKIARLTQAAPDLFIAGYPRKCMCPLQPIVVPDDEISAWENKTFRLNGKTMKRQVMKFPPNSPIQNNFVCPDDQYPFPGVKKNTLANKDKYLGLPCCFANDQLGEGVTSKYKKFYEGQTSPVKEKVELGHLVKSDKMLEAGRYGVLPKSIGEIFGRITEKDVLRLGVPRDPNSLLHCVSLALGDKKYLKANPEAKANRIFRLRKTIAQTIRPGLLRQQLYDYTDAEIVEGLQSGFLDPNLYYRAVEEAYNINLFVFAPSKDESKRLYEKSESTGVLELPRFKLFYARNPYPKRKVVCVYRTLGSERDVLEYPQCELIVFREDDQDEKLFGKSVYDLLWETLANVYQYYTWELVDTAQGIQTVTRKNVSSQLDLLAVFPNATSQYIDEWGKLRALYLPVGNAEIMIATIPSAPVNLPSRQDLVVADSETVLELLTEPTGKTVDRSGRLTGLWFSILDLPFGLYVPAESSQNRWENLKLGPASPLPVVGTSVVSRIYKLEKDLNYIVQIFRWLYSLSDLSLEEFVNNYVGIGRPEETDPDSANIYDFRRVGRQFPKVSSVEQGIQEMSERVPSLFSQGRIFLYSDKLYNGLFYLTQKFLKERVKGRLPTPTNIVTQPLTESDFRVAPGTAVFLSQDNLENWARPKTDKDTIHKQISEKMAYQVQPYLYMHSDGHVYMVQNVAGGSLGRSLTICDYWEQYKINLGYSEKEELETNQGYVVYGIDSSGVLVPISNTAGNTTDFWSVIQYNSKNYAALLRLL